MSDTRHESRTPPLSTREEAELERLRSAAASLPRSLEPPRDLWPGIAARLAPRPRTASRPSPWRWLRALFPEWTPRQWAWQAATAVVFLAAGTTVGGLLARPAPEPPATEPGQAVDAGTVFATARLAAAEVAYLRAKEDLWLALLARRESLSPFEVRQMEGGLRVVDGAIAELHLALAADPGNRQLAELLLANHKRSLALLGRLAFGAEL